MQDPLDTIQDTHSSYTNWYVVMVMDYICSGWASATATAADWDVISLMTDTTCKHPKWTPWPFDYTKESCAHCGEERRFIRGRQT